MLPKMRFGWLSPGTGLRFGKHGSILSAGPLACTGLQTGSSCTVELWLEPGRIDSEGTILAFYDPASGMVPFALRQFRSGRVLQRMSHDSAVSQSEIYVGDVFSRTGPVFVTIRSGEAGTSLYVDGNLLKSVRNFTLSSRELTDQFVVGDAPANSFNWSGMVKGLAVYNRELTDAEVSREFANWTKSGRPNSAQGTVAIARYLFDEGKGSVVRNQVDSATNLIILDRFFILHQQFLERPWDEFSPGWRYWKDIAINVAGFISLGFFFRGYFAVILKIKRSTLVTIVLGFAVSLTIEVLQSYLPTRDSGMTDFITNTFGTALGAACCAWCLKNSWFARLGTASALLSETELTNGTFPGRTTVTRSATETLNS